MDYIYFSIIPLKIECEWTILVCMEEKLHYNFLKTLVYFHFLICQKN